MAAVENILVIAHPDDESMFFLPTMLQLENLLVLCLTAGDYDGLGSVRRREMEKIAGIFSFQLHLVDDPKIPDHPKERWPVPYAANSIRAVLQHHRHSLQRVITFDHYGVSGHVNHQDTHRAVHAACRPLGLPVWQLQSVHNPIHKYVPLYCWIQWILVALWSIMRKHDDIGTRQLRMYRDPGVDEILQFYSFCPELNWMAMRTHHSQFVWYRRLFVVFSVYTYHNILRRVDP